MKLSPQQNLTLLAMAGVLGPHGFLRALLNTGVATDVVGAFIPVTQPRAYLIDALFLVRDRAAGTVASQRQRITVDGDPAAPAIVPASNIATFPYIGTIAVPPTLTLALVGLNIQAQALNPLAAPAAGIDVDVIFFGPYIGQP
jgi:hypothetical protein